MAARGVQRPAAVFDIETESWDRFVCGALLRSSGELVSRTWHGAGERELVEAILSVGEGDVMAHNGGRFDFLWFVDALFRYGLHRGLKLSAVESGATIVALSIRGPGVKLRLRDSFRMFPLSLRTIGGKEETGLTCTLRAAECQELARLQEANGHQPTGCGGYCAIRRGMPRAELRRLLDYCVQDCRALAAGLDRLMAFAEDAQLQLGGTTGSTAWRTARAWELVGPTPLHHRTWWWLRRGYFGGRVGLFRPDAAAGHHYDITSSYPHQTAQPLPDGEPRFLASSREAGRAFRRGRPGLYRAMVEVPESFIPPLPYRCKIRGERRNAYPVGRFGGTWALPELEYAESVGVRVELVDAVVFPREVEVFAPLMAHLIGLRLKHGKDTPEGRMLKLWANSLYGKFAQETPRERLVLGESHTVPEGSLPIGRSGLAWLVPYRALPPLPDCSHVEKAATITARGRVQLHRMLVARGGEDAVYADTDSCFATSSRAERDGVRAGLGGWSYEGPFRRFQALAPKLYRYDKPGKSAGSWSPVLRAKGIALPRGMDAVAAEREWTALESGAPRVQRSGVLSLRTALRTGGSVFRRKELVRRTSGAVSFGDRVADGASSRPPRAEELEPLVEPFPSW